MNPKKRLIEKTLEVLAESAMSVIDLFIAISESGYGASQWKIGKSVAKHAAKRRRTAAENAERHAYDSLIYKLKREGFISNGAAGISLTSEGRAKLKDIQEKNKFVFSVYEKIESPNFIIFSYDISGKKFQERRWLKNALLSLELRPIQQSVWIGKVRLPEVFLDDLKRLDILKYIEIFEITKKGTLREI